MIWKPNRWTSAFLKGRSPLSVLDSLYVKHANLEQYKLSEAHPATCGAGSAPCRDFIRGTHLWIGHAAFWHSLLQYTPVEHRAHLFSLTYSP